MPSTGPLAFGPDDAALDAALAECGCAGRNCADCEFDDLVEGDFRGIDSSVVDDAGGLDGDLRGITSSSMEDTTDGSGGGFVVGAVSSCGFCGSLFVMMMESADPTFNDERVSPGIGNGGFPGGIDA